MLAVPNRNTLRALALLLSVVLLSVSLAQGCGPAREGLMSITPGVPANVGCTAGVGRCTAGVPEVCSASGRWWPALPRDAYGAQRTCTGACVMDDAGVPYCVGPVDAGVDAGDVE